MNPYGILTVQLLIGAVGVWGLARRWDALIVAACYGISGACCGYLIGSQV